MNEEQKEYARLILPKTIQDNLDLFDIYIKSYMEIIRNHHNDQISGQNEADAKILLQMMMSKLIHLRKLIEGVGFKDKSGNTILHEIIDPTIVSSLVRNLYETTCAFHLIYINPKSSDDSLLVYLLWVSAGLKYRQRFNLNLHTLENIKKLKEERDKIDELEKTIHASPTYKRLDFKNAQKIDTKIKQKDYRIQIDGNDIHFKDWFEIPEVMGCRKDFFKNMYTYFSLYSHPSNVSVFQFTNMFRKSNPDFVGITVFNLRFCFAIASIFLADYLTYYSSNKKSFEKLPLLYQALCNYYNRTIRSKHYSINDSHRKIQKQSR